MSKNPLYLRKLAVALSVFVALLLGLVASPANASSSAGDKDDINLTICKVLKEKDDKHDQTFKFSVKPKKDGKTEYVVIAVPKGETKKCEDLSLKKDWYTVKEVEIPDGYQLHDIVVVEGQYKDKDKDDCRIDVHVKENGKDIVVIFINKKKR
jgi:hypothetical protein